MNILIIGTGMYVCGRGTENFGTILPAIYEWKRDGQTGDVYIAGTQTKSIELVKIKVKELNEIFGFEIHPIYLPEDGTNDREAYKKALQKIPKPACAIVVVPDHLHREIAGDTIQEGLHTLVVKPLAPTLKEVQELIELQKKSNVYCAVEFHKRFDRSNLKLRDTIQKGAIGSPLYFIVEYSQRKSVPSITFRSWVETTNIFQYLGIHYVDIIYFATGAKPLKCMAIGQKNYLVSQGIDTYDSIQAVIEWQGIDGQIFTSSLFANWIDSEKNSAMSDQKIKVIGTKGRYEADQKCRGISVTNDRNGIEDPNPDFCSMYGYENGDISFRGYGIESVVQFFKDVNSVETGKINIETLEQKRPTFNQSIVPTVVIEGVNKSLSMGGRWVELNQLSP